jgi:hypothetical protein
MNNERNEYIAIVTSRILLEFCRDNDLPFDQANELITRNDITEFQYGWLVAYLNILEGLIE